MWQESLVNLSPAQGTQNVLLIMVNGELQPSWEKYNWDKKLLTAFLHNMFASNGHVEMKNWFFHLRNT